MEDAIRLPVVFCLLVDFPNNNIDCTTTRNNSRKSVCFTCPKPGKFLFGDMLDDHGSAGHVICAILWIFILVIGIFGAFTNCLIISIMKKHRERRSFDFMLTILASFDLISCVMASMSSTAMIIFYEGVNRGPATLVFYYIPFLICLIGRSGSVYMTVLITIERYLVLTFPLKCTEWFSSHKTKLMAVGIVTLAVMINIPRFTSVIIDYNDLGQEVTSLRNLPYVIRATGLERFWYKTLGSTHYILDIWVPFPILIVFNVLLFIEIRKFTNKRRDLNTALRRDIRAARMFVPVVIVLFICNLEPITHYVILHFKMVYYRELVLGMALSIVLNASANLPIYYARGPSFRGEIRAALPKWCGGKRNVGEDNREVSVTIGHGRSKSKNEASSS